MVTSHDKMDFVTEPVSGEKATVTFLFSRNPSTFNDTGFVTL